MINENLALFVLHAYMIQDFIFFLLCKVLNFFFSEKKSNTDEKDPKECLITEAESLLTFANFPKETDCFVLCSLSNKCAGAIHVRKEKECHHLKDMTAINRVKGNMHPPASVYLLSIHNSTQTCSILLSPTKSFSFSRVWMSGNDLLGEESWGDIAKYRFSFQRGRLCKHCFLSEISTP